MYIHSFCERLSAGLPTRINALLKYLYNGNKILYSMIKIYVLDTDYQKLNSQ